MLNMPALIESIPNISEGRDMAVIQKIASAISTVPGAVLADYSSDPDHNRSVFTIIGAPEPVGEAVFILARKAVELIDLNNHKGVHPRIGAVDVIPFVPLKNADMQICVEMAKHVSERIGNELGVPVLLYGDAAVCEENRDLSVIRKNYHAGIKFDYGPPFPHPTAGAAAVGARKPLIAFNVNLNTNDLTVAKKIARIVRASNGGLPNCKALGVRLRSRGIVQITMNMTDYKTTPLHAAFDIIKAEAEKLGVEILESELIGLAPAQAFTDAGARYLKLADYHYQNQILENYI
jgi:glutamate formiminotransferase